jgi:hypothetical protein
MRSRQPSAPIKISRRREAERPSTGSLAFGDPRPLAKNGRCRKRTRFPVQAGGSRTTTCREMLDERRDRCPRRDRRRQPPLPMRRDGCAPHAVPAVDALPHAEAPIRSAGGPAELRPDRLDSLADEAAIAVKNRVCIPRRRPTL